MDVAGLVLKLADSASSGWPVLDKLLLYCALGAVSFVSPVA